MSQDEERDDLDLVTTLQDAVQPAGVPVLPMFDLDGHCLVSSDASEPGGSWFDVVVLPDDRLALVVGEAPGLGLTPAITAAQMRAVIHAGLRRDGDVVTALQLADLHADDVAAARGTTAVVVVLDPDRRTATYATAGHPPPLLVPALGSAELLSDTGGGPLGTGGGTGYVAATSPLSPGDSVLLVGAPGHRAALLAPAGGIAGDAWSLTTFDDLQRTADGLAAEMTVDDTVCLVAARLRAASHRALVVALHGAADPVRTAREELDTWMAELRASPMDRMALTHAAAELVTNAVEHGSRGNDQSVELRARLGSDGCVLIEVVDHGAWQVPSEDLERGRGLAMAAGLVDHLGVSIRPSGTRALLQHRLVRPVAIDATELERGDQFAEAISVGHPAPQTMSLHGTFRHDDVERVAAEILLATRGGTVPLSLDLTGVTRLSTSAVRLLADLTSVNRGVGTPSADIDIVSTENSVVQQALEIARVPQHGG